MNPAEALREFVARRLSDAAGQIFSLFLPTLVQYQETLQSQQRLVESSWRESSQPPRTGERQERTAGGKGVRGPSAHSVSNSKRQQDKLIVGHFFFCNFWNKNLKNMSWVVLGFFCLCFFNILHLWLKYSFSATCPKYLSFLFKCSMFARCSLWAGNKTIKVCIGPSVRKITGLSGRLGVGQEFLQWSFKVTFIWKETK